jgi:hypothetical protein
MQCELLTSDYDVRPWDGHYKSILLPADEEIMGVRLGMAFKASKVVGNPVTLHQIW